MTETLDDDREARLGTALPEALAGALTEALTGALVEKATAGSLPESRDGPASVAAIGGRAARLLDAAAATASPGSASVSATAPFRGPRFEALADCVETAPDERTADAALLTLDALAGPADADRAAADADELSPDALGRALGTACRLYPARLLLFVRPDEAPPPETLFAFGFRRLIACPDGALHEYCLRDYKTPPDWLNTRFWANPERFDLDPDDDDEDDDSADEEA